MKAISDGELLGKSAYKKTIEKARVLANRLRKDGNHTLEKQAVYNLNIMRKLALNILKLIEVGSKALSLKKSD